MDADLDTVPRDARMLVLFDEIYRTKSMTRAAERLGLSQPTASIWLSKLRRFWHDPIFVRTSAGMQPTPHADALIGRVREVLGLLRHLSDADPAFDPGSAKRNFRLCMTDASHITLLPQLLSHVRSVAPGVRLDVAPISSTTAHMLEMGEADLALGLIPGLEAGFHDQRLYTQDFVCLINVQHPRIRTEFSARAYQAEGHIGILSSTSYTMLQNSLKSHGIARDVQLELPGFLGLAAIVSSTDLIATVPRMIGEALASSGTIRVVSCPVRIPSFTVKQYWHVRYHDDPGIRWLRASCARLFARDEAAPKRTKPVR
jgi:DNA-binding transcriptional LysR family regulator